MNESIPCAAGGLPAVRFGLSFRQTVRAAAGAALLLTALGGCRERPAAGPVTLYARAVSARDSKLLEIQAQFTGSLENVHYKWFALSGECHPQESTTPVTRFRFAADSREDRITVDVWRGDQRLGQASLDVRMASPSEPAGPSNLSIEVTDIPPAEKGGPDTRTTIAGRITGELPPNCRVVVYARDEGVWFIQPTTNSKHPITENGTWSTWTHSGSAYAVLIVPADFVPLRTLDSIPSIRGDILGRVVVDGRPK